jgi:hypothetical protein
MRTCCLCAPLLLLPHHARPWLHVNIAHDCICTVSARQLLAVWQQTVVFNWQAAHSDDAVGAHATTH